MLLRGFCIFSYILYISNAAGGPYPGTFDCPMRQLALDFALEIQPDLSLEHLQDIADALNGSPEKSPSNCTVSPNNYNRDNLVRKPKKFAYNYHVPSIFIDPVNGRDTDDIIGDINNPFKSIGYGLNYIRKTFNKNELKQVLLREGVYYLKDTLYFDSNDRGLIISNYNGENAVVSGGVLLDSLDWSVYKSDANGFNIYMTTISESVNITSIVGLRINNTRAIRARYPNGNPEVYPPGFGSQLTAKQWIGYNSNPEPDVLVYPDYPYRDDNVEGYFQHYNLGIGGTSCFNFEPPGGYWCSSRVQGGGATTYRIPSGMIVSDTTLPNTPYANITGGIIQAWRQAHWASWMFEIESYDDTLNKFEFLKGGYQGGRGADNGAEFYVENIFEELDDNAEWYFNESTRVLYYKTNVSNVAPTQLVATKLKVLMNFTGTMDKPAGNVEIKGITFRDSAITYMDPHAMPSGGDWALQRTGSIYLDGCTNVSIHDNLFTRLDNIAISINRYNRDINITHNEFVWLGASAVTLWGDTTGISFPESPIYPQTEMGWDGTTGNQPRGIQMSYNYIHEIGIWEKQSSCLFQSKSCQNRVFNNICYNGPRAGFNINDGFGGASIYKKNLIFNTCRESGDHGPINTWDRQVYVTKVLNGTATYIKAYDNITQNFLISNYQGIWAVDDDDGSTFYNIFGNFEVYATGGLKNNFGGHNIRHYGNIFGYVQNECMYASNANDYQLPGYIDYFNNNICVINSESVGNWGLFACGSDQQGWPLMGNNTIYIRNQSRVDIVGLCQLPEKTFQTKYQRDLGTQIVYPPNDTLVLEQAKQMLWA